MCVVTATRLNRHQGAAVDSEVEVSITECLDSLNVLRMLHLPFLVGVPWLLQGTVGPRIYL